MAATLFCIKPNVNPKWRKTVKFNNGIILPWVLCRYSWWVMRLQWLPGRDKWSLRYLWICLVCCTATTFFFIQPRGWLHRNGPSVHSTASRCGMFSCDKSIYFPRSLVQQDLRTEQARFIECTAINDVNFYSLLILLISAPMIYFMKDSLLERKN